MNISKTSREKIFASLKATDFSAQMPVPKPPSKSVRKTAKNQRLKKFTELLESSKATVHRTRKKNLGDKLREIVRDCSVKNLFAPVKFEAGIDFSALENDPEIKIRKYRQGYAKEKEALFSADASISEAQWGIAETGALAIASSPENPRTLSLATPTHICLLNENRLHADLESLIKREKLSENLPTNLILISGPSRTADIEFNISFGIHGPKQLIVLLHD